MRIISLMLGLGWLAVAAEAASPLVLRKFVMLGDQSFEHPVSGDDPAAAENEFVKIGSAGFVTDYVNGRDSRIHAAFGFTIKQPLKVKRVTVEEVSGREPAVFVTDGSPKLKKDYWAGNAADRLMNAADSPWLYVPGDDWRIFRFTITTADHGTVVLLQPSRLPEAIKRTFVAQAEERKLLPAHLREGQYVAEAFSVVKSGFQVRIMPLARNTGRASPELIDLIKQSKTKKVVLAICSEHAEWALEVLRLTLASVEAGSLKDHQLIVVAPQPDAKAFALLGQTSGLTISAAELPPPLPEPGDRATPHG